MSDSLAPSRIVAKLRSTGSRRGDLAGKPGTAIRFALIAAVIPVLFASNMAVAQVSGMATPTPSIGATSPLGIGTGSISAGRDRDGFDLCGTGLIFSVRDAFF